jgi:TRAP-type C4-dicarboxylate transport system permease small subunit
MTRLRGVLETVFRALLGLLLLAMVALDGGQVLLRYVFSSGVVWGGDVSALLLLTLGWLGAPALWLNRSHIAVDLFPGSALGGRAARAVLDIVMIAGGVWLFHASLGALEAYSFIDLPVLPLSASVKYLPITVGAALLALVALLNLLDRDARR